MQTELGKTIRETLEKVHAEHKSDKTLSILYDAIEKCSNEDFKYDRGLVFDMFFDNESLIEDRGGKNFYAHTGIEFKYETKDTIALSVENMIQGAIDDEEYPVEEVEDWIKMEYKSFVFFFFKLCLYRMDEENEGITDYLCEGIH